MSCETKAELLLDEAPVQEANRIAAAQVFALLAIADKLDMLATSIDRLPLDVVHVALTT